MEVVPEGFLAALEVQPLLVLAGMVNIGVFHKAYPDPHAEQDETLAAANPEAEEEDTDVEADEVEPTTADADAGNTDLPPASDEPAAP